MISKATKYNFGTLSAVTVTDSELIIINSHNERKTMTGSDWQQLRPMMQAKALNLLNEEVVVTTSGTLHAAGCFLDLEPAA